MFLVYVISVWLLVLAHLDYRTQGLLGLRGRARLVSGVGFLLLGFAYIPVRVLIHAHPSDGVVSSLALGAAFLVGFAAILWTLLVVIECAAALLWLVVRLRLRNAAPGTRRIVAIAWWAAAGVLSLAGIILSLAAPATTRLQVSVPGADRERLVVISDTHLGAISSIAQWRRTLEAAHAHDPLALIIVGDLVDDRSDRAEEQVAMIREFFPTTPVYVVTGNHERYAGVDFFERICLRFQFRLLRGESETILPGLIVAGIDDSRGGQARSAVERAVSDAEGPLLFLTHRPENARFLSERPLTLALAGHTHGGQIPPMIFLTALGNGGFSSGAYEIGRMKLYVSRGAGVWGPPMRLLAPSEIMLVEVRDGPEFEWNHGLR